MTSRCAGDSIPRASSVLPNPAPEIPLDCPLASKLREELELDGNVLVFAGRLGPQKALGVVLRGARDALRT